MKKRILSVLITLVMLIGLVTVMSISASAAGTTYKVHVGGVQVTDANKDDITAAIIAAGGNATGKAAFDPTTSTLTLEDFAYEGGGSQYWSSTQFAAIWYELDELKIELKGNNIINAKGNDSAVSYMGIENMGEALTINDYAGDDSIGSLSISGAWAIDSPIITINGGTVTATGTKYDGIYGTYYDRGDITINGGTVIATGFDTYYGICNKSGAVNICGGEVVANGIWGRGITISGENTSVNTTTTNSNYGLYDDQYTDGITINGGTVTATSAAGDAIHSWRNSIKINGGTVTATGASDGIMCYEAVIITGGTVNATGSGDRGIFGDDAVTISGGTVNATGNYGISCGINKLTIAGGTVIATGNNKAMNRAPIVTDISATHRVIAGTNIDGTDAGEYDSEKYADYKYIKVSPITYNIATDASSAEGGEFSVNTTSASAGETVTITPSPVLGYMVDTVKVYKTDDESTTVPVTDNQFTMPAYPVTVSVTFKVAPVSYDLWVGGVQVTDANKANIVVPGATGTATYDPATKTLTLNNFSYTGQGYVYDDPWCAAIFAKNDLTVKVVGSNTVTASVTDPYTAEALKVLGSALTITGDSGSSLTLTGAGREGVSCGSNLKIENVTVNATGTNGLYSYEGITINNAIVHATATTGFGNYGGAIYANKKNITIENSKVTATAISGYAININGTDYNTCTIKNSDVTISNAKYGIRLANYAHLKVKTSTLTITAIEKAIDALGANRILVDNHLVHAGDDAASATAADSTLVATYENKYVKIEPPKYDLWVAGVQVTGTNLVIDSTDSADITSGSATFDPDTNTLTLNNFKLNYSYDDNAIYSENFDLTIKLVGENTITSVDDGIEVDSTLTIVDDDSDSSASSLKVIGWYGIYASDLIIENAVVEAIGLDSKYDSDGINSSNSITISDSTVTATGMENGICAYDGDISISDSTVTAAAMNNDWYTGGIYTEYGKISISNSNVKATGGETGIYSYYDLTISDSTVTAEDTEYGIIAYYGYITISGENTSVTATGAYYGIFAEHESITVTDATVKATATDEYGIGIVADTIIVTNATVEAIGTGESGYGMTFHDDPTFNGKLVIYEGDDAGTAVRTDDPTYERKYVKIAVPYCDVTVNYGIDGIANKVITIVEGDTVSLENPVIDSYVFMGWFADENFTTAFDFTAPITAATTIYAKFADYKGDIKDLYTTIDNAKKDLQDKIDSKVDKSEYDNKINTLEALIETAKEYANKYADELDAAQKTAYEKAVSDAVAAITEAYTQAIDNAKKELQDKIDSKASIKELNDAIADFQAAIDALEDVKTNYIDADTALKTELETTIDNAKSEFGTLIAGVQSDLNTTNENLDKAIEKMVSDLAKVQKELADAIAKGDSSLSSKINSLNSSLRTAKTALENADAENKAALEAKIETAEATLNEAIKSVQKNLEDAKVELNRAIADGDIALNDKISNLNEALEAAKKALETADMTNKSELTAKIDEANAALHAAIDELSAQLDDIKQKTESLEQKNNELQSFMIIASAISVVTFCGCATLVVFYIVDKKKKI